MTISATPVTQAVDQGSSDVDDFELDVRIVETGSAAATLLGGTDDGCDTVRGSDC
jgi:FxLD family lantipeptide